MQATFHCLMAVCLFVPRTCLANTGESWLDSAGWLLGNYFSSSAPLTRSGCAVVIKKS